MTATKETFIDKLNEALEWEYAAAVQYVQHAAVITGAEYDAIAKEFLVHANEELNHAITVATSIADLGGIPSTNVEKREISNDSKTMLEQDLSGEDRAISIYKNLIHMAEELGEYGIRRLLEDILIQEEEHRRDILNSLGK